jgi:PAS domain S-box-containing protein
MSDSLFKHALVVDDEPSYRMLVEQFLSRSGYQCDSTPDAAAALQKLRSMDYDLVITDIQMPDKDGLQLMKEAKGQNPALHFIVMTGHTERYSYSDIIEAGAADFLAKPFEMGELLAKIQRIERERATVNLLRSSKESLARESWLNASIAELSKALMASVAIGDISRMILKSAQELTGSGCGCVVQRDPGSLEILRDVTSTVTTSASGLAAESLACERCRALHDRFAENRLPVLENEPGDKPGFPSMTPDKVPVRRFLAVPVVMDDVLIGSISQANSGRDYTASDLELMVRLAEVYAIAIRRKRDEEALAQAKEYIEKVFDSTADAIGIIDRNGRAIKWNQMASEMFGYSLQELQTRKVFELYADRAQLNEMQSRLRRDGFVQRYEIEFRAKDGSLKPCEMSVSLLRSDDGAILGSVGVVRDLSESKRLLMEARAANEQLHREIAERKRIEEEVSKAHSEIAQLVASIPSILIGLSGEDHVLWWNTAAEETFGVKRVDALGQALGGCNLQWKWEEVQEGLSRCRRTRAQVRLDDIRYVRPNGKEGILGISINPLGNTQDEHFGAILQARDITDRKHMESQLAQAQKLESIGQLAAGIAHEINTPTQYVGDNNRFLQDAFQDLSRLFECCVKVPEAIGAGTSAEEIVVAIQAAVDEADLEYLSEEIPKAIQQSLEGVERVSKIVRAMKEFSHPGMEEKTAIDINNAIESTLTVARNEWKYVAEVVMDLDRDLPLVPCLPGEFNQVILNMVINAAHAISDVIDKDSGEKGTITVSTRLLDDSVEIRLTDTGSGIPEAVRPKIFDPFFTTKEVGKGTGQGLAISHSVVVDKHGGNITFESEMGKGTTFIIRLPLDDITE